MRHGGPPIQTTTTTFLLQITDCAALHHNLPVSDYRLVSVLHYTTTFLLQITDYAALHHNFPVTDYRLGTWTSLVSVLLMASLVVYMGTLYGAMACVNFYLIPLFIFASYTVIITFLHHSEVSNLHQSL